MSRSTGTAAAENRLAQVAQERAALTAQSAMRAAVSAKLGGTEPDWAPYREFESRADAYAELMFLVTRTWDNVKRNYGFGTPGPKTVAQQKLKGTKKFRKRLVVQVESAIDVNDRERLSGMFDEGMNMAVYHPVKTGMTIIDGRILAQGDPTKSGYTGACVLTHDPMVVRDYLVLFEDIWSRSLPFQEAVARAEGIPTTTHMQLLRRLAGGVSRDVAAAELKISPRTHTRYVHELCSNYQVGSKVELVVKIRDLGLLP